MDADWVNRGGILAEAISFLLIAPEIIGIERIQRVEARLEGLFRRASRRPELSLRFGSIRPPFFRPLIEPSSEVPVMAGVAFVLAWASIYALMIPVFVWGFRPPKIIAGPVLVAFLVSSVANAILTIMPVVKLRLSRTSRLHRAVVAAAWLAWMTLSVISTLAYLMLVLPFAAATKLLEGPDRLRSLVFSTGVILLFGGMAAQFVGTF